MTKELEAHTHDKGNEMTKNDESCATLSNETHHVHFESNAFDPDPPPTASIPNQGLQRKATPLPQQIKEEDSEEVEDYVDIDDAPMPLKESKRDDVFAEHVALPFDASSSIPKQGLQRKGTPLPQAMRENAHGPLSSPNRINKHNEEDEEVDQDDMDDAPMPLKERPPMDFHDSSVTSPTIRHRQRQATPIPSDMLILTGGKLHVGDEKTAGISEDIVDDAPMPLKESERDDVFAEHVALPSYTASSIPKQGLQRKGTPLPQAMKAKVHGPLTLPNANIVDETFVSEIVGGDATKPSLRQDTPYVTDLRLLSEQLLAESSKVEAELVDTKEVGFVPGITGGGSMPPLRQGTPCVTDLTRSSEQVLAETGAQLLKEATRMSGDGGVVDESTTRDRLGTPFPTDLLPASVQIRAEFKVDAINEDEEETKEVIPVSDAKDMEIFLDPLVQSDVAGSSVSEKGEGDAPTPPRGFLPSLFRKLKSPGHSGRKLGAPKTK